MQQDILLWCVAAPAIISLAFVVFPVVISRPWCKNGCVPRWQGLLACVGWCVAVTVTLVARQNVSWWPTEAWQQVIWPIACTSLALGWLSGEGERERNVRWMIAGIGTSVVAMLAMPSDDGWTDVLPLHRYWMAATSVSGLLNMWMLDRMARNGAGGWVLWVGLASLGTPAILAASTYGGLAEWLLAAISSTFVFAIAMTLKRTSMIWCAVYSTSLFGVAATTAGRFYTYEEHPVWLYAMILLLPTMIALVDTLQRNRSTRLRVIAATATSILFLTVVAWRILGTTAA